MMRTGLIFKKIGMTQVYDKEGRQLPVTVLKNEACEVIGVRRAEKNGYHAVLLGAGAAKPKNIAKPQRVVYEKAGIAPKHIAAEFRVKADEVVDVGSKLSAAHFVAGQLVDATAQSIGKGFAGAMKRHNFSGLRASHGVSISHRSHGSTGQCQDPGKVFKGKKMAGHMGARRVTVQNLEIVKVDEALEVIFIKGAVPGARGSWVQVRDAVKRAAPKDAPHPAGLVGASQKAAAQDAATQDAATQDAATQDAATQDAATQDAATQKAATQKAATQKAAVQEEEQEGKAKKTTAKKTTVKKETAKETAKAEKSEK